MNTADSESLARRLLAAGYVEDSLDRADVAILNTCVVRQASEERVYARLHELKEWKTPERTVAVTGCIVAKERQNLQRRFPLLNPVVVPIGEYEDFVAGLEARYDYSQGEALPSAGRTGVSHYVRVIQGCDHNCTFCIVPRVRGRERHVPLSAVMKECREAVDAGAKEVVLLGQNVDDYRDPEGRGGLAALVAAVERIPGLMRLRFMTSHPQDLEPQLLEVMARDVGVQREVLGDVGGGDPGGGVPDEEVDLPPGRVAECRGHRGHRGGEVTVGLRRVGAPVLKAGPQAGSGAGARTRPRRGGGGRNPRGVAVRVGLHVT